MAAGAFPSIDTSNNDTEMETSADSFHDPVRIRQLFLYSLRFFALNHKLWNVFFSRGQKRDLNLYNCLMYGAVY